MLHFFKDKPPTLEEAQAIVGGLVEMVPLMNPENMQLLINEEGLMHDLPVNTQASMIAAQCGTRNGPNTRAGIRIKVPAR